MAFHTVIIALLLAISVGAQVGNDTQQLFNNVKLVLGETSFKNKTDDGFMDVNIISRDDESEELYIYLRFVLLFPIVAIVLWFLAPYFNKKIKKMESRNHLPYNQIQM
ncbi:uncharacterized protein [Diabrotica undecimpunctata]